MNNEMMYHRVLRSVRHDLKHAKKRIQVRSSQLTHPQDTLEWRRDFRPEVIPPDEVAPEAETGKHVITGFDKESRPILYLRPGRENTKPSPRQIRYLVWSLERCIGTYTASDARLDAAGPRVYHDRRGFPWCESVHDAVLAYGPACGQHSPGLLL